MSPWFRHFLMGMGIVVVLLMGLLSLPPMGDWRTNWWADRLLRERKYDALYDYAFRAQRGPQRHGIFNSLDGPQADGFACYLIERWIEDDDHPVDPLFAATVTCNTVLRGVISRETVERLVRKRGPGGDVESVILSLPRDQQAVLLSRVR